MRRRDFIFRSIIGCLVTTTLPLSTRLGAAGLDKQGDTFILSNAIHPSLWQRDAFEATTVEEAIKSLHGPMRPLESSAIKLDIPIFAESSRMVPVTVSTSLPKLQAIHILVTGNTRPLSASFDIAANALPSISTRIAIDKTSDVIAIVKADGKLFMSSVDVLVDSVDGCVTHKVSI